MSFCELEDEQKKKDAEVEIVRRELEKVKDEMALQDKLKARQMAEIEDIANDRIAMESREKELWNQIIDFKKMIEGLKSEIVDLIGKKACSVGEYDAWNNKVNLLKAENSSLTQKRNELAADVLSAEEARARITASNTLMETGLTENIRELRTMKDEVEKELVLLRKERDERLAELEEKRLELENEKKYAQQLVETANRRNAEMNYQIGKMKEFVSKMTPIEAISSELKSDLRVLAYSINEL